MSYCKIECYFKSMESLEFTSLPSLFFANCDRAAFKGWYHRKNGEWIHYSKGTLKQNTKALALALKSLGLKEKESVGIIARVPLASGLLTGKFTKETVFGAQDHRTYNREGAAFDKGETFSKLDYRRHSHTNKSRSRRSAFSKHFF